jgi:hypothetical protein
MSIPSLWGEEKEAQTHETGSSTTFFPTQNVNRTGDHLTSHRCIPVMCDAEHQLLGFAILVGTGLFTLTTGFLAKDEGIGTVGSVLLMAATLSACVCSRRPVHATATATATATALPPESIPHAAASNRDTISVSTMYDNF